MNDMQRSEVPRKALESAAWIFGATHQSNLPRRWRLKPYLTWTRIVGRWNEWWILNNPLTGENFRCAREEALYLKALQPENQTQAISELRKRRIADNADMHQVAQVLSFADQANLLLNPQPRKHPLNRKHSQPAFSWLYAFQRTLSHLLFNQIKLGNPHQAAKFVARHMDFMFSCSSVRVWMAFIAVSLVALIINFGKMSDSLQLAMTTASTNSSFWLLALLVFCATRVLHESAHAVACVRLGGRCTELGLVRVLFVAFPFVDVSDAWKMPSKSHRMAISSAGLYLELIVCAFAVWVWLLAAPGLTQLIAMQIIALTLGTSILFNANPLMRYDGYYVMSELLEIPNPQSAAKDCWRYTWENLSRKLRGEPKVERPWMPSMVRWFLHGYGVSAWLYRGMLTLGIVSTFVLTLAASGLADLAWTFVSAFVVIQLALIMQRQFSLARLSHQSLNDSEAAMNNCQRGFRTRLAKIMWGGASIVLGYILLFIQLPSRVRVDAIVLSKGRTPVTVSVATSTLQSIAHEGAFLVRLATNDVDRNLAAISQEVEELHAKETSLMNASFQQPDLLERIPQLRTIRELKIKRYNFIAEQAKRYHIDLHDRSQFVPISLAETPSLASDVDSPSYGMTTSLSSLIEPTAQTVLSPSSLGRRIESSAILGYVVPLPRKCVVEALISQSQRASIDVGTIANVSLAQQPHTLLQGRVNAISQLIKRDAANLASASASEVDQNGYLVEIAIENCQYDATFVEDGHAQVVFKAKHRTLFERLCDFGRTLSQR